MSDQMSDPIKNKNIIQKNAVQKLWEENIQPYIKMIIFLNFIFGTIYNLIYFFSLGLSFDKSFFTTKDAIFLGIFDKMLLFLLLLTSIIYFVKFKISIFIDTIAKNRNDIRNANIRFNELLTASKKNIKETSANLQTKKSQTTKCLELYKKQVYPILKNAVILYPKEYKYYLKTFIKILFFFHKKKYEYKKNIKSIKNKIMPKLRLSQKSIKYDKIETIKMIMTPFKEINYRFNCGALIIISFYNIIIFNFRQHEYFFLSPFILIFVNNLLDIRILNFKAILNYSENDSAIKAVIINLFLKLIILISFLAFLNAKSQNINLYIIYFKERIEYKSKKIEKLEGELLKTMQEVILFRDRNKNIRFIFKDNINQIEKELN